MKKTVIVMCKPQTFRSACTVCKAVCCESLLLAAIPFSLNLKAYLASLSITGSETQGTDFSRDASHQNYFIVYSFLPHFIVVL